MREPSLLGTFLPTSACKASLCKRGVLEGDCNCLSPSQSLSIQLEPVAGLVCLGRRRLLPPLLHIFPTIVMLSSVPNTSP